MAISEPLGLGPTMKPIKMSASIAVRLGLPKAD